MKKLRYIQIYCGFVIFLGFFVGFFVFKPSSASAASGSCSLTISGTPGNYSASWSSSGQPAGKTWLASLSRAGGGSSLGLPKSGSQSISPPANTVSTYTILIYNQANQGEWAGTCSYSIDTRPANAAPVCMMTSNAYTVNKGDTVYLDWGSVGATSATLNYYPTTIKATKWPIVVNETTDYTLRVYGPGGSGSCGPMRITVKGGANPPGCDRTPVIGRSITTPQGGTGPITVASGTPSVDLLLSYSAYVCRTNESQVSDTRFLVTNATPAGSVSGLGGANGLLSLSFPWTVGAAAYTARQFSYSPPGGFTKSGSYTVTVTGVPINYFPVEGSYICVNAPSQSSVGGWNFGSCPADTMTFTFIVNVTGGPPPASKPTCALNANPSIIDKGQSSRLTWSSVGGTSWGFADSPAVVGASGFRDVTPSSTTTYIYLVVGPGGSNTCTTTVTVNNTPPAANPPSCNLLLSPATIKLGDEAVLSWTSLDATAAVLSVGSDSQGVNVNNPSGTKISPSASTKYILTVYGPGGSSQCSRDLTVSNSPVVGPECTLSANPAELTKKGSTTLSWASKRAISFTVDNGVGNLRPRKSGSRSIPVDKTTVYEGTVTDKDGVINKCYTTVTFPFIGPYHKVYGGDVSVGKMYSSTGCTVDTDATILALNQDEDGSPGGNRAGAGAQLAAFAIVTINGFASGQIVHPDNPKNLTFANSGLDTFGGNLEQDYIACPPNYWTATNPADIEKGNRTIDSTQLNSGQRITRYIEGNVYIKGNITYANTNYANISQIPAFRLVVKGNIYVDPGVTELNGTFVALPKDGDTKGDTGKFYTCAQISGPPTAIMLNNECKNNDLTVYGAVIADLIKFTRSGGLVSDAKASERYNNTIGHPAERFIYTPETWLTSDFGSGGENDGFSTLPPVL